MNPYHKETNQFVEELKQGQNNILVAVRVRPLSQKEQSISEFETVRILDGKVVVLLDPGQDTEDVLRKNRTKEIQFAFDYVFDQWVIQQTIYEQTTDFLMNGLFDGYNATIFSYGATGSGKTFTMIGTPSELGIMPRAMQSLFQQLQSDKLSSFKEITVKVSYLEIYNENIRDLLTTEDKSLDVREDKNAGIVVAGITEVDAKSVNEVMALLKVGNKNRSKEATEANLNSSRSHAILQLQIDCKEKNQGLQENILQSKLSLVDLAGSERASNTNNKGIRMVEGAKINQSLLVLGNCIQALSDAAEKNTTKPFIPYRNSKLTRLLKDSLGGNCRTVMISNISPSVSAFEETYNTLVYANRAKNIKTVANRNVLNAQNHISNYAEMIKNLRQENEELKHLIQNNNQQPAKTGPPQSNHNQRGQSVDLDASINQNLNDISEIQRKLYDLEDREDNFQQNLVFLQHQQRSTKDAFEQMRYQDRVDNCVQQMNIIQKSHKDLQRQYDELLKKRDGICRMVDSYEETAYRNYLKGLIKQGDLQLENVKIRHQDKRNRNQAQLQEQQIQQLKNQLKQSGKVPSQPSDNPRYGLPQISTKNPSKQSSLIPGVNSPYPKANNVFKQQYIQKRNLVLPPINLLNLNKLNLINQKRMIPQSGHNKSQAGIVGTVKSKISVNRVNYQQQGPSRYQQRSPSVAHARSSKSQKGRQSANRSMDYLNTSDENQTSYSMKRLRQMHDQYQAQRFKRALSGKRNQNSMPTLNNKILLPGMVHESPYVKNFQKDLEPLELKRERLRRLNMNMKDQGLGQFRSN